MEFHDLSRSTVIFVRILTILFIGINLSFDLLIGPDFLKIFPLKLRDIYIFVILFWFLGDRRAKIWSHLYSILLKNWEMWALGFVFGFVGWILLRLWLSMFMDGNSFLPAVGGSYERGRSFSFLLDSFNAALVDELVFKLFLLISIQRWIGRWGFVLASGMIWSLGGLLNEGFPMMAFMMTYGVLTAYIFLRFKNLGFLVFAHFALFVF